MPLLKVTFRILLLFAAFMVWQTKGALAHGLETHDQILPSYSQSSNTEKPASVSSTQIEFKAFKISSSEDQKSTRNCNGSCCSSAACCAAALLHEQSFLDAPKASHDVFFLTSSYPLGPPFSFFRPPRFSA